MCKINNIVWGDYFRLCLTNLQLDVANVLLTDELARLPMTDAGFHEQQREENPGQHISDQLWALHKKWTDLQGHQPRSQLSETVGQ